MRQINQGASVIGAIDILKVISFQEQYFMGELYIL